jgi:hypothetical protein
VIACEVFKIDYDCSISSFPNKTINLLYLNASAYLGDLTVLKMMRIIDFLFFCFILL